MQDAELQPLYRNWANHRWPQFAPVEEVSFGLYAHGPYSDVTPDLDQYVGVSIRRRDGRWALVDESSDLAELLADILGFDRGER